MVLGATSDIGIAIAREFAKQGYDVQLAARNIKRLMDDRNDIQIRYDVGVSLHELDILVSDQYEEFLSSLPMLPDVVVSAIGLMGDQKENQSNIDLRAEVIRSNFEGPASLFSMFSLKFRERRSGTFVGISSVAGERGRASNYIYGASKAGFTAYLSGMRNELSKHNVHVVTVLPGFVYTKMTQGMDLPKRLTASPEDVAQAVLKAVNTSKDVIYVKTIWRLIMTIIKMLPERIFKKTNL